MEVLQRQMWRQVFKSGDILSSAVKIVFTIHLMHVANLIDAIDVIDCRK